MGKVLTMPQVFSNSDIEKFRKDFPILSVKAHGKPLIYFDNAATSQKPQIVIDSLVRYYSTINSNIHRGVHFLSQKASQEYDEARIKVQNFINAASDREIVFVRGTTEGINLVASSYGRKNIMEDDVILISAMEHHSNIVPWQLLCEEKKAKIKVIPMNDSGELMLDEFDKLLSLDVKFISVTQTSNSLGTINPIKEIIRKAHLLNIPVMIDAAQSVVHSVIDVIDLDCDFLAFSSHKMFGPTGIGVLYGKEKFLEAMPPYQGGGEMINSVSFEKSTWNEIPFKFEAGTPDIAGVIGLGAAIDYLQTLDREKISKHEHSLLIHASEELNKINGIKLIGTATEKAPVVSFIIEGVNAMDAGMKLESFPEY